MAKYSQQAIEEIKTRLTISDVASQYSRLVRKGRENWCCCPIHGEKTPSMILHDDTGLYKCFGCGKSGNMFSLVQEMERVDFPQAVEILAKKAGVELKTATEKEKIQQTKKQALQNLYNKSMGLFHYILLNHPAAEAARNYINKRKISEETIEKFQLGFAPSDKDWLYGFLKSKDYSDELLKTSGLFSQNYEKLPLFRNRVMFPVRNWQGECVAFGARDLSFSEKAPKYINSPETDIYQKRYNLFGFYESLKTIKEKEEVIICEGNFDVISLHQAGLTNAVAPLGTAFTDDQCHLIKRFCKKASLLFDSDNAGQKATFKALMILQTNEIENFVIRPFENAKDASQMLEEQGEESLRNSCINISKGFNYLVHLAEIKYDIRDSKGISAVCKEVRPYLDVTKSPIERQGYIKYLAQRYNITEQEINGEINLHPLDQGRTKEPEVQKKQRFNIMRLSTDLNAMLIIFNHRELFEYFTRRVKINDLEDNAAIMLYTVLEDARREGIQSNEILVQMIENQELKELVFSSANNPLFGMDNPKNALEGAMRQIQLRELEAKRNNISALIGNAGEDGMSTEDIEELLFEKTEIDSRILELRNEITGEKKRNTSETYLFSTERK